MTVNIAVVMGNIVARAHIIGLNYILRKMENICKHIFGTLVCVFRLVTKYSVFSLGTVLIGENEMNRESRLPDLDN
jgi:hypothetical protein